MSKLEFDLSPKPGKKLDLRDWDPADDKKLPDKEATEKLTEHHTHKIGELQNLLYTDQTRALLVVLQGMDASGKDGTIRKVFDHVNPQGVEVVSFKEPTELERRHDFLWRVHSQAPALGNIGVFNRSHYEDVIVVKVHADKLLPEYLREQRDIWKTRYELINSFEELLTRTGVKILKFFLHLSREEQAARFRDRQKQPEKNWKLSDGDITERKYWDDYMRAYEKAIFATNVEEAPWYIIPADRKWVRNYHIARIIHDALEGLNLKPRKVADAALLKKKIV